MNSFVRAAAALALPLLVAGAALALPRSQDSARPAAAEKKSDPAEVIVPFFGNENCPMTGRPVNRSKYVEADGQKAWFCCNNCLTKAKADPKAAIASAYKETKAAGNKTCPISGHEIEAGKAVEVTFESRRVSLCCADCEAPFKKSPLLHTAIAVYGAEDLKNKICPVMDEESCDDDLVIYKGKIVRLCCGDCVEEFAKDPEKLLAKASGR